MINKLGTSGKGRFLLNHTADFVGGTVLLTSYYD